MNVPLDAQVSLQPRTVPATQSTITITNGKQTHNDSMCPRYPELPV
jgi:hypothetical protein